MINEFLYLTLAIVFFAIYAYRLFIWYSYSMRAINITALLCEKDLRNKEFNHDRWKDLRFYRDPNGLIFNLNKWTFEQFYPGLTDKLDHRELRDLLQR